MGYSSLCGSGLLPPQYPCTLGAPHVAMERRQQVMATTMRGQRADIVALAYFALSFTNSMN
jgi:hypothetical protein